MRTAPVVAFALVAAVVVGVTVGVATPPAAAAGASVRVVHSLELVRPGDLPASFGTAATTASLRGIRNEFESFQVVVHGGDAGVTGVSASMAGPLAGPGGAIVPAGNVRLYAERYYTVTTPSDLELFPAGAVAPGLDGQVRCPDGALHCRFPDALVPERDVFYEEDRNAFPFDVPPGQNRVIWVDVLIPEGAALGSYAGTLQVTGAGLGQAVPVAVEVLDLGGEAMPSTPTLRGGVQVSTGAFCPGHGTCAGIDGGNQGLYDRYLRASLENRFPLTRPMMALPDNAAAWTTYGAKAVTGTTAARLPGARVTDVLFTRYDAEYDAPYADEWKQRQASVGRTDLVSYYCDEMNAADPVSTVANPDPVNRWDDICEPGYDQARALWDPTVVAPAPGPLPVVHTGSSATLAYGRTRPGHDAADNVDTLVLLATRLHNPSYVGGVDQRPTYDPPSGFLGEDGDHQVWLYTSCEQAACVPAATTGKPLTWATPAVHPYVGTPGLLIDQPPSQVRSLGWHDFTYRATGDFYYQAVGALDSAWGTCAYPPTDCQFVEGANGDGNLFYPGTPAQIGGTNHIPVESIRLKRVRDGREDFEVLHWLSTNGRDADARAVATSLFPNLYSSNVSAADLAAARDEVLDLLAPPGPSAPVELAYTQGSGTAADVWVMAADGSGAAQLTGSGGAATGAGVFDGFPDWSPDGTRIAFTRGTGTEADLWLMDADGSDQVQVTGTGRPAGGGGVSDAKPAWSPDGRHLAFVRGSGTAADVWIVTADGQSARRLTVNSVEDHDPSWSPEGTKVVYASRRPGPAGDLYRIGLDGSHDEEDGWVLAGDEDLPDWGLGDTVAADHLDGGDYDIVAGPTRVGGSPTNLTAASSAEDFGPSWSPAGDRIAFTSTRTSDGDAGGDGDLFTMSSGGTDVVRLTADATLQRDVDWRPEVPGRTFVVTGAADGVDAAPGDGTCATAGGTCTLRAAVMEANATPTGDRITLPAGTYGRTRTAASPDGDQGSTGSLEVTAPLTIVGAGAATTVVDANSAEAVLAVEGDGTVLRLQGMTVREGVGAGVMVDTASTLLASDCAVRTTAAGAALDVRVDGAAVLAWEGSAAVIRRCELTGAAGAGVAVLGTGTVLVEASTVTGSLSGVDLIGTGAAPVLWAGMIVSSTLSGNTRGLYVDETVARVVGATIIANADPIVDDGTVEVVGSVADASAPAAVGLGPLAANGGPTRTHLPQPGSALIDAGDPAGCPGLLPGPATTDQRGSPRPTDGDGVGGARCDLGAVEAPPVVVLPGPPTAVTAVAALDGAEVSWTAPVVTGSGIVGYEIAPVVDGVRDESAAVPYFGFGDTSFVAGGACSARAYQVRALTDDGPGPWSSASSVVRPWQREGFTDVVAGHPFVTEIGWMATSCTSNGYPDGTYHPGESVSRQAMAAFLHRLRGDVAPTPAAPYFADVGSTHPFFDDIQWMAQEGISTGTPQPGGKPRFEPGASVDRQAMAAFLHRLEGDVPAAPTSPHFADVAATHPFFDDIQWMAQEGISTGTPQPGGKPLYRPGAPVDRQAMAAFLHRLEHRP